VRKAHQLTQISSSRFPEVVIFLDTETYSPPPGKSGEHRFRLGWVCVRRARKNRKPSYDFSPLDATETFWKVLDKTATGRRRVYLLAHRVIYDLWIVGGLKAFIDRGWKLKSSYANGRVVILRFHRGETTLCVLDTLNLFPAALKEWGEAIGYPKLKVDLWKDDDKTIGVYCFRDVEILVRLWDLLEAFIGENDFGGMAPTVSSLAFRAFRHRFMDGDIYIHAYEPALELERAAYYGGRTECFRLGVLPDRVYTILDVNSMYPYVMQAGAYPVKIIKHWDGGTLDDLRAALRDGEAVARVRVRTDRPVVPYRGAKRIIYPVGTFDTDLAGPELRLLLKHGMIEYVYEMAAYERGRPFRRYVESLYRLRRKYAGKGLKVWEQLVKLMLNGLYGKFGQKAETWEKCPNYNHLPPGIYHYLTTGGGGMRMMISLGGEVWVKTGEEEAPQSFPGLAAYVTSHARVRLWKYMEIAGFDNLIYCDTDSLIVTAAGVKRLAPHVHPTRLGALKHEYEGKGGEIHVPKDYRIGSKVRRKGVSPSAVDLGDDAWLDTHWPGWKGLLASGNLDKYQTQTVVKHLRHQYEKGMVGPGGDIRPIRLEGQGLPGAVLPSAASPLPHGGRGYYLPS